MGELPPSVGRSRGRVLPSGGGLRPKHQCLGYTQSDHFSRTLAHADTRTLVRTHARSCSSPYSHSDSAASGPAHRVAVNRLYTQVPHLVPSRPSPPPRTVSPRLGSRRPRAPRGRSFACRPLWWALIVPPLPQCTPPRETVCVARHVRVRASLWPCAVCARLVGSVPAMWMDHMHKVVLLDWKR